MEDSLALSGMVFAEAVAAMFIIGTIGTIGTIAIVGPIVLRPTTMDAFLNIIADVFDWVSYHFHIIFSVMCGLIVAAWVNVK